MRRPGWIVSRHPVGRSRPTKMTPAGLGPLRLAELGTTVLHVIEVMTRRRPLNSGDLPLRLKIAAEANGRFRYLILRNNGTVAQASSATFSTEAAARAAGGPVLRRRSLAAKLTRASQRAAFGRQG
jgi:hypothetical protein